MGVLKIVLMKIRVFWDATPHSAKHLHFKQACCLHLWSLGTPRRVLLGHVHPQDEGSHFLQNADNYIPIAMVLYHRRIYLQEFCNNFTSV